MHPAGLSTTIRGRLGLCLIGCALLLRLLVPAGWMPATGGSAAITLCTGAGAVPAWVDGAGRLHRTPPGDARSDHPCAFAVLAAAIDLRVSDVAPAPVLAVTAPFALSLLAVTIGRGLAAPPPPPTGPPAHR